MMSAYYNNISRNTSTSDILLVNDNGKKSADIDTCFQMQRNPRRVNRTVTENVQNKVRSTTDQRQQ